MRSSDLDAKLLRLSPTDYFTARDAAQSVAILGGTGSGKTTGTAALKKALLGSGMGGIVLCAKAEEADLWRRAAAAAGRQASLMEFSPQRHGFNFLGYELARQGSAGINSVVECLMRVLEAARSASSSPGRAGDAFWEETTRQILRNTLPVLFAVTGTVRIPDIVEFVRSAPRSPEEMHDPDWQSRSIFCRAFLAAEGKLPEDLGQKIVSYWRNDYATLDAKTRGNISISLTTTLDRFNHGWLQQSFCGETTLFPELCFHGAIILLNMPVLTLNEDAVVAQQVFKYMWQRAVLARNGLPAQHQERFVFCWADEAQYFVNSFDAEFLSTSRSSRCCTVFLSQSLPTFYAKMGGENARDRVHHLLGNFGTKIFHSNGCAETNEWASRTIGRTLQRRETFNEGQGRSSSWGRNSGMNTNAGFNSGVGVTQGTSTTNGQTSYSSSTTVNSGASSGHGENRGDNWGTGANSSTSWGYSEQRDYLIEPGEFARTLKTGGPANGNQVSAVWFQSGRTFGETGTNCLLATFEQ